ncbi:MAG: FAD-binding protein [Acidimicrobiia bacterium]|nr:FAD-binding protein [Acidimicrobiia bacterium]
MSATSSPEPTKVREHLYRVGEQQIGREAPPQPTVTSGDGPPGFPSSIRVDTITFTDWSQYISVPDVQIARVVDADDVVAVCNWAATSGYTVRASGKNHNWSPLLLAHDTAAGAKVMLVDTAKLDSCSFENSDGNALATFGPGITLADASAYLEGLDNGGAVDAPGFAFPQLPAPGNLTLGGALAIGAHGTVVPLDGSDEDAGMMGCLSNLITSFEAVVTDPTGTDPDTYALRRFERTDEDAAAFLVHLGRAFITSVTMVVEPNYYLELTCLFPEVTDLFSAPGSTNDSQFASLLDTYGRVELLWFPYNSVSFVQCNKRQATRIDPQVKGPYNYPWMNDIGPWKNAAIKAALQFDPKLTPDFTLGERAIAELHQKGVVLNGTARDLEIYLEDTTLRVTLFGWALQIQRGEVQAVAHQFFEQLSTMLDNARQAGSYPINAAAEIRCTTVDTSTGLPWSDAAPAALAVTNSVDPSDASLDTVIWLNVGTITGTPGSNEFYTELEAWIIDTWGKDTPNRLRPEWSKAWAYSDAGPWTNTDTLQMIRESFDQSTNSPYTFDWAAKTLAGYDRANLFRSPLLDSLFATG